MHRYSEEDVASVVLVATAELRRRQGRPARSRAARTVVTEMVRSVRTGVLPREQYERARGESDAPYSALPQDRQDEDRLLWLITQAMTGE